MSDDRFGVLLMTYGSPSSLDDVERYLTAVRGGRQPDPSLVAEFRRRYEVIGGSPLIAITQAQAAALEERLGGRAIVRAAMRFSEPSIATELAALATQVEEVVAVILSPQYSDMLMAGYRRALEEAAASIGPGAPVVRLAGAWHDTPAFLDALAERVRDAVAKLPDDERTTVPIALTAHSLPARLASDDPAYLAQLRETADEVGRRAGVPAERRVFCWQSAGHEPGEWMKPDLSEVLADMAAAGHRSIVVVPIQFLADHLEILYDVDVAAREQAEAAGIAFGRIESLNVMPRFIDALAAVSESALTAPPLEVPTRA